ncbi:MAG: peptidase M28 family protein [Acidobacteria bacterium]|nr:MAG: peptidase M28 family protein [Acidobacteriota bacterium]REK03091.1 MAG: peptidase M28 family protein [Acidobacteriota bacterium]REK15439.1 MAG: peptidase M28 family protein [Acidobacteriota bacterium]REK45790.1 MAG: peptidase M28 family protein [Acidobacteriota bacterium]
MHKTVLVLAAILAVSCVTASAQMTLSVQFYSDQTISELEKLRDAALADEYSYRQTSYLTNNIGPRLSGSPQAARAVQYVAEEMRKLGLEVNLQELKVPHWVRGKETGELVRFEGMAPGTIQKIVLTALGGSVSTGDNGITAEVVVVEDFSDLGSRSRSDIEGKIVLFNVKYDQKLAAAGQGGAAYGQITRYRGGAAIEAAKLGAVAVLVRSAGGSQNRLAHTGGMRYEDGVTKIPAASVPYEDAELIADLANKGELRMKLVLTPQTLPDATSYNVIADLKGSEKPEEIIVVSGHLDSWDLGTGALDDAVGVAMAMQVPYLIKKLDLDNKRTIRVVAFMNEENGFVGADTYASNADIANHFAALESDLGAEHPIGFLFAGNTEALPMLRPLSSILSKQGASLIDVRPSVSSDISRLTEKGVPSLAPWYDARTYFNYHHTEADTLDKVNPKWLRENSSVMAVLAYGLSNLERPLPR